MSRQKHPFSKQIIDSMRQYATKERKLRPHPRPFAGNFSAVFPHKIRGFAAFAPRAADPPRAGTEDLRSRAARTKDSALRAEGRSAPPSLWGGIAATALLGRAASAAFDAGSPWVGRPESIQSKGAPTALRAVGNKETVPPGGTREKSPGPRSTFAYLKPKYAPAPHRARGKRPVKPLLLARVTAPTRQTEAVRRRRRCR